MRDFGGAGKFALRSGVTGLYCNATLFGGDPSPGVAKACSDAVKP